VWELREDAGWFRTVKGPGAEVVGVQVGVCDFVDGGGKARGSVVVGSRKGEDFLVEGCSQGYGGIYLFGRLSGRFLLRIDCGGEVSKAVLDPAFKHTRIPGLIEWVSLEAFCGGFARGPLVAPIGGELCGFGDDEFMLA
jgi:hypothetical protein